MFVSNTQESNESGPNANVRPIMSTSVTWFINMRSMLEASSDNESIARHI